MGPSLKRLTAIPEDACTVLQFKELTRAELYTWAAVGVSIIALIVAVALVVLVIRLERRIEKRLLLVGRT